MKTFLNAIANSYKQAYALIESKNKDYATLQDPYRNFRFAEYVGLSVEQALLLRMSDKFARICRLTQKGGEAAVKDETIADTLLDLANYSMILKTYLEQKDK